MKTKIHTRYTVKVLHPAITSLLKCVKIHSMSLRKYLSRRTDDINYTNRDCKDNVRCNLNAVMSGSKL